MAYDFGSVIKGGISIEEWFKSLWLRDKNASSLAKKVRNEIAGHKRECSPELVGKVKLLFKKIGEAGNKKKTIDDSFIERLDLDKWSKEEIGDEGPVNLDDQYHAAYDEILAENREKQEYLTKIIEFVLSKNLNEDYFGNLENLNLKQLKELYGDLNEDLNQPISKDPQDKALMAKKVQLRKQQIAKIVADKRKKGEKINPMDLDKLSDEDLGNILN